MKARCIFLFLFLALTAAAQQPEESVKVKSRFGFDVKRRPAFTFAVFANYSLPEWQPEIIAAVAVQNDAVQFEKSADSYRASLQTTVAVLSRGQTILSETYFKEIRSDNFEETNARDKFQYEVYRLRPRNDSSVVRLEADEYECFLEIRDLVSQKSFNQKLKFKIGGKEKNGRQTDIAFLTKTTVGGNFNLPLAPVQNDLEYNQPYLVYARQQSPDTSVVEVNLRVYRKDKKNNFLVYQTFSVFKPDSGAVDIFMDVPFQQFTEGEYQIRLSMKNSGKNIEIEKDFSITWFEKPTYLYKTDLAIRPMRYMFPDEEFKRISSLGKGELESWFRDYWKEKDPTPETDFNELLAEYFQRVQEANRRFNLRYKEGWETDQGRIFLLYGQPEKIDDRKLSSSTYPHEIWIYADSSRFVFVDRDRDGEFELLENQAKE